MKYQIVATLGPATADERSWSALREAGAGAFRLNTSHIELPELADWLERLDRFRAREGSWFPLVLDLQGSKWRLGRLPSLLLETGRTVELLLSEADQSPAGSIGLPVPHPDFFQAAALCRDVVALNDARVLLDILETGPGRLLARVRRGGAVSSGKGITLPGCPFRAERLGEKDRRVVELAAGRRQLRHALSYVRDGREMSSYRRLLGGSLHLIAKLERESALRQAGKIALSADELWLCRGDLGAEMGEAAMAVGVARFSAGLSALGKPVLLAGQVLEHMSEHPQATRSEVCHLHDMLRAGFAGVVLSDETALGRYPLESCRAAAMFRAARLQKSRSREPAGCLCLSRPYHRHSG